MKDKNKVFIMGDSYSTYEGYIPKGYAFYYSDNREEVPVVSGVEKTGVRYLCLKEIDKENGHPTELGMKQISMQVNECLHKK